MQLKRFAIRSSAFYPSKKNIILPPCIACNIVKNTTLSYVSRNLGDRGNALARVFKTRPRSEGMLSLGRCGDGGNAL